MEMNQLG